MKQYNSTTSQSVCGRECQTFNDLENFATFKMCISLVYKKFTLFLLTYSSHTSLTSIM